MTRGAEERLIMNEFYDFEDEDEDEKQLPDAVQSYQPSILPKVDQNDVRTRLMNYYKNALNPRRFDAPLSPTDIYTRSALQTGGLQGMAQGLAQAGTVFSKTPTADSFVQSSDKTTKALAENAAQIAQSSKIDPRIAEYLLKQPKKSPLKSTSFTTPGGKPVYFDPDTGQFKAGDINVYRKPEKEGKEGGEKLPIDAEEKVKIFSKKSAEMQSGNIALKTRINEYKSLLEKYEKTGDKQYKDDAIRVGKTALKILNSAGVGGSDAVGAEEVQRLGDELERHFFNLSKPGPLTGYDLQGFQRKVDAVINSSDDAIADLEDQIADLSNRPRKPRPPRKTTETPLTEKEKQELGVRIKVQTQGK